MGAAVPGWFPGLAAQLWAWPVMFFLMSIGYEGGRIGRKTYVVDIAEGSERTDYVSASDTVIAAVILVAGGLAAIMQSRGPAVVILVFSVLCLVGSLRAMRLKPVTH